jgi:hypothetical protein
MKDGLVCCPLDKSVAFPTQGETRHSRFALLDSPVLNFLMMHSTTA